ncbi:MAG: hypothetical protein ACRDWV_11520 [Acidimicrobiales bacterium]
MRPKLALDLLALPSAAAALGLSACSTGDQTLGIHADPPLCGTSVTIRENVSGGLSHEGFNLVFANPGSLCSVGGYPMVKGLAADGAVVFAAADTPAGYLGGLQPGGSGTSVYLSQGEVASALVEGIDGPVPSLGPCPDYKYLEVSLNGGSPPVRLTAPFPLCYLQVHPLVAGPDGGANTPS